MPLAKHYLYFLPYPALIAVKKTKKKPHKPAAGFTDEASSNSLSCTHTSCRTSTSPCVLHYALSASPVWLPAGAVRQRGSTSVKADVDVFIRAVTAAQDPFNTPAYLALFHARCSRGSVPSLWEICHVILT